MDTCTNKDIKDLLPAYQELGEELPEGKQVGKHLEICGDCRRELALLRTLAEEPVPDPGEAFWAAMPDRVFREINRHKTEQPRSSLATVFRLPLLPRWAWACTALAGLAAAGLILFQPVRVDMTAQVPAAGTTLYDEYTLSDEPVDFSGLKREELDSVATWANRELSALDAEEAAHPLLGQSEALEDELAGLDGKQLRELQKKLDSRRREV